MSKWKKERDARGEYWVKKTDVKNYVIFVLVFLLMISGSMCIKVARDNHYMSQELEMYYSQPDYNQPQD